MVRREICFKNLSTVKLYVEKQLPAIVQECGAVYIGQELLKITTKQATIKKQ